MDVSWRLLLRGWKCFYEPDDVAYHGRGTGVLGRSSALDVAKNRKSLSKFQKMLSYRNERLMRVKNDLCVNVAHDFLHILWKEILMAGWILLRQQYFLKTFFLFFF